MFKVDWAATEPVWQNHVNVVAAWAFGSAKDGVVRDGGDLDIALLLTHYPSLAERLALMCDLQAVFPMVEVDTVVLNGANSVLRFEAVSGRVLFCRDRNQQAAFVSLTAREYEDDMALVEAHLAR